jgi:two-component system NarL family sensor kinase
MKLRHKIILFAVMPLVLALCAIALTVRHHAISLAQQEQEVIKPAYLASKEAELKNYVALATHAIAHLYKSGRTDAAAKNEAKAILEKLEYGDDGYFFVYDLQGTMLIHPRQQGWVGKNMWDFKDATGKLIIQSLISRAHAGGGFENFGYWAQGFISMMLMTCWQKLIRKYPAILTTRCSGLPPSHF